jgi:hypothetical protein
MESWCPLRAGGEKKENPGEPKNIKTARKYIGPFQK